MFQQMKVPRASLGLVRETVLEQPDPSQLMPDDPKRGQMEYMQRRKTLVMKGSRMEALDWATDALLKAATDLESSIRKETKYWDEILSISDKGWSLHVPRDLQERTLAVSRATEALSKELGRSPKVREVAEHLGCSVEKVLEAQEAAASYEAASLDAPAARDDGESASLVELLGREDCAYELVEDREIRAQSVGVELRLGRYGHRRIVPPYPRSTLPFVDARSAARRTRCAVST